MEFSCSGIEGNSKLFVDSSSGGGLVKEENILKAMNAPKNIRYELCKSLAMIEEFIPSFAGSSNNPTEKTVNSVESCKKNQDTVHTTLPKMKVCKSFTDFYIYIGGKFTRAKSKYIAVWFFRSYKKFVCRVLDRSRSLKIVANDNNYKKVSHFSLLKEFILRNKLLFINAIFSHDMKIINPKEFFSMIFIAESYELYVNYFFSNSSPEELCNSTKFLCCQRNFDHDGYCEKKWNRLEFEMKQEFIEAVIDNQFKRLWKK